MGSDLLSSLTDSQMNAFVELKKRTSDDVLPKDRNDDAMYLRFLRARDYNVDKAEFMLRNNIQWRKDFEHIEDNVPPKVAKYFGFNFLGFDTAGCSMRYLNYGNTDIKGLLKSATMDEAFNAMVQYIESDVKALEQQSKKLKRNIETWTFIIDFENTQISQVTHKPVLALIMRLLQAYEANYPERLKYAIIINASVYFTMLFNLVKPLLAAATLQKVRVFGKTGYKDKLLEFIDPDILPAFLGGDLTDPDGNPKCNTFINHGGMIPKKYYFRSPERRLSFQPGVKKYLVSRMSKLEIPLYISESGSHLAWEFETENRDIEFGLYYRDQTRSEDTSVIPKQRIEAHLRSESGVVQCNTAGTYVLVFDNSYSWLSHKDLFCKAVIVSPNGKLMEPL